MVSPQYANLIARQKGILLWLETA